MIFEKQRPWLWLPASVAHNLGPSFLKIYCALKSYQTFSWSSLEWRGLKFANPLGLAAGMDKNATQIKEWWKLGAGFLEIGTIVPQPQSSNPKPIIDRNTHKEALWNKLGFPSVGLEKFKKNLEPFRNSRRTPLFINIGKNRTTSLQDAHKDYVQLISELNTSADAFVINISSPNTKDLRNLMTAEYLQSFLGPIVERRNSLGKTPLLLKLSPDLSDSDLEFCLFQSLKMNIDGWVLSNTTQSRTPDLPFPVEGGVSGRPLAPLSKAVLRKSIEILGEKKLGKLVVSVGGILEPEDVLERLSMGADLIEIYSALAFKGPDFFKTTAQFASHPTNRTH